MNVIAIGETRTCDHFIRHKPRNDHRQALRCSHFYKTVTQVDPDRINSAFSLPFRRNIVEWALFVQQTQTAGPSEWHRHILRGFNHPSYDVITMEWAPVIQQNQTADPMNSIVTF